MKVNKQPLNELLLCALNAAFEASVKILEIYESAVFEIEFKNDLSPITRADKIANALIEAFLTQTHIPILSEESKQEDFTVRQNWNQLWIVDPIDGTKEFIQKNGDFTVNIALIENQVPILGVILIPVTQEVYFATKELGSFKSKLNQPVSNLDSLLDSSVRLPIAFPKKRFTFVASQSHDSLATQEFISAEMKLHENAEIIRRGSSLKLCMLAEGTATMYPRLSPTMEWDIAAGHAICLYAGFDVIDFYTKKSLVYNKVELLNNWFIAQ
jgi:3'(2'), 5'-bisphosphate nucleotidase